ncbi:hypothetical protein [Deinococcus pimensis]|uniref:hypothetical protein n=1 Tax=Deinococcus pimensis TaxID=309888 RepID=UPI0012FC229E|nr:hypothetical protein [Deinococcus pimensis]
MTTERGTPSGSTVSPQQVALTDTPPGATTRVRFRSGLLLGLSGAALGLVTTPFLAVAGFLAGGWSGIGGPPLLVALHAACTSAFGWSEPIDVQQAYGRPLLFVLVALLLGLGTWWRHVPSGGRAARVARWCVALGFTLGALGNVTDYWLGFRFSAALWSVGFGVLTVPGLMMMTVGSSMLGVSMLRARVTAGAVALSLTFPAAALDGAVGLHYLPAAPLFALCLAWLVVFATALKDRASS